MDCVEFEILIPDYLEKQLSPAAQSGVAEHLAGCAACRALARQLEQLDVELARTLKAPALPPEFRTQLQQRIQTILVWSEAERAERKRQLQAEYEAGLARLRLFPLAPRGFLLGLSHVTLLAFVGWLGWQFPPYLVNLVAPKALPGLGQDLPMALTISVIFMGMGLTAAAFSRQLKRVLLAAWFQL